MKLTVEVTSEDIRAGLRFSAYCCPLSLAIRRAASAKVVYVGTSGSVTVIYPGNVIKRGTIGQEPMKFRENYDHNREVEPFSFEMELAYK